MSIFEEYLKSVPAIDRSTLERVINLVKHNIPEATEGYSYGFPSFKCLDRPLLGFGYKNEIFSLYPFDPKIIAAIGQDLYKYETGKGYVRFTSQQPISDSIVLLMVDLRIQYLKSQAA